MDPNLHSRIFSRHHKISENLKNFLEDDCPADLDLLKF